jgi:hypothetical protein
VFIADGSLVRFHDSLEADYPSHAPTRGVVGMIVVDAELGHRRQPMHVPSARRNRREAIHV